MYIIGIVLIGKIGGEEDAAALIKVRTISFSRRLEFTLFLYLWIMFVSNLKCAVQC